MNNLIKIAAPLFAAFALAGCATQKPLTEEEESGILNVMMGMAVQDDFTFAAACRGEQGRAAILSYSEGRDEYMLQRLEGRKVEVSLEKPDPQNAGAQMQRLNVHCFPK
jgi:hypothetical protein